MKNGTVKLLSVHPKALKYYKNQNDIVEVAKALPFPLEVDFYSESPYDSISKVKLQYFTDSIIEEVNSHEDDDRQNTWSLAWFVTDSDEINTHTEEYWNNIK